MDRTTIMAGRAAVLDRVHASQHAGAAASPPRPAAPSTPWERGTATFAVATFFACLVLQRFALPLGSFKLSVATPIVLTIAAYGVLRGHLAIDTKRGGIFMGLCAAGLIASAGAATFPVWIAPRTSWASLIHWLALSSFAALRFTRPADEGRFLGLVTTALAGLAAAGLVQFAAQFAGLQLFSFKGLVPETFLIEELFNVEIPMQVGGWYRANGLFLVEPSVFSQFVAVGIALEATGPRRPAWLTLFFAALVSSVSGTGWMVLGAFVLAVGVSSGARGALAALAMATAAAIAVACIAVVLPEAAEVMLARTGEFTVPGTSGHARFVTPFLALGEALDAAPWTAVTGLGPGTSEYLSLPYEYAMNTPVKILLEYGGLGLALYLALLLCKRDRTPRQRLLLSPLLTMLMLTGGYHQFSPVLFPVLLISTVASLSTPVTAGKRVTYS